MLIDIVSLFHATTCCVMNALILIKMYYSHQFSTWLAQSTTAPSHSYSFIICDLCSLPWLLVIHNHSNSFITKQNSDISEFLLSQCTAHITYFFWVMLCLTFQNFCWVIHYYSWHYIIFAESCCGWHFRISAESCYSWR